MVYEKDLEGEEEGVPPREMGSYGRPEVQYPHPLLISFSSGSYENSCMLSLIC